MAEVEIKQREVHEHDPCGPSSAPRLVFCPGSRRLQEVSGVRSEPTQESEEGTLIHRAIHEDVLGLTDEQADIAAKCRDFLEAKVEAHFPGEVERHFERTLYLNVRDETHWGTPDLVVTERVEDPSVVMVNEWKTGRLAISQAAASLQLGIYAAMASQHYGGEIIYGYVYQPRLGLELARTYTETEIAESVAAYAALIERTKSNRMVLNPVEEACAYCPCHPVCPALRATGMEIARRAQSFDLSRFDSAELGRFYSKRDLVDEVFQQIRKEIRARCLAGDEATGYQVREVRGNRVIRDAEAALEKLSDYVPRHLFRDALSLSVTKAETVCVPEIAQTHGCTRKEAREKFECLLEGVLERQEAREQLVKAKDQEASNE